MSADVLDATRECVLAVGVRRTTLTDVARRAGVSRMTLYRRVPDVNALILAVLTREFRELMQSVETDVAGLVTARERLVAAATSVVERMPTVPVFRRILEVDPELLLPYLTGRVGSTQRLAIEHVRQLVAAGIEDGSIRDCDPEVVAYCLVQAVTPHVLAGRRRRKRITEELHHLLDAWLAPAPAGRRRAVA